MNEDTAHEALQGARKPANRDIEHSLTNGDGYEFVHPKLRAV